MFIPLVAAKFWGGGAKKLACIQGYKHEFLWGRTSKKLPNRLGSGVED